MFAKTKIRQILAALEALKVKNPKNPLNKGYNAGLQDAIDVILQCFKEKI